MLVLVIGGSGSGKSEYAEERVLLAGDLPRYYVATMEPGGREANARIGRHRALRAGKGFETVECACGLERLRLPQRGAVLIEDLSNLAANEIWSAQGRGFVPELAELICEGVFRLEQEHELVVVVGNDIHRDCGQTTGELLRFAELLGGCHALLAARAHEVTEVVCGIALHVKAGGAVCKAPRVKGKGFPEDL